MLVQKIEVLNILKQRLEERRDREFIFISIFFFIANIDLVLQQLKQQVKERVSNYFHQVCRNNNFLAKININMEEERIDMLVVACHANATPDELEKAEIKVTL